MKLVARILIILFVNKLNVCGEPILQNLNLTAENEILFSAASLILDKENFSEFNIQKNELPKDKNVLLKGSFELDKLASPFPSSIYRQANTIDVKDLGDNLEMEKSVTETPFHSLEEYTNSKQEGKLNAADSLERTEGSFMEPENHNSLSIHQKELPKKQDEGADTVLANFAKNSVTVNDLSSLKLVPDSFVLQEKITKPKVDSISGLPLNFTTDLLVFKAYIKHEGDGEAANMNISNQTWAENRAKTINEYIIATKPLNSNEISQSSNLAESELIEIVLKDATNSDKKRNEENSFTKTPITMTESAVSNEYLKEEIYSTTEQNENILTFGSTNDNKLGLMDVQEFENYSTDNRESVEEAVKEVTNLSNIKEGKAVLIDITPTTSEGTDITSAKPLNFYNETRSYNASENELDITDLEEIRNRNKIPEENSFKLETTITDDVKLTAGTPKGAKRPQTSVEHYNEQGVVDFKELLNSDYFNKLQNENSTKASPPFEETVLSQNPVKSVKEPYDYSGETGEVEQVLKLDVNKLTAKPFGSNEKFKKEHGTIPSLSVKATHLSSIQSLESPGSTPSSKIEMTPGPFNEFEEHERYTTTERNSLMFANQQLLEKLPYSAEYSSFSLDEEEEENEKEQILSSKPLISLEEYAVKQMNFVLDHLLLETQKFVATVLQATINSVFPRDRLKQYAEGVNQVLNPVIVSDYSDEIFENSKTYNPDEIYEQIVEKLNFLKSKPSKYLQKQIPPEWLNDFLAKRTELAIWLDKAAEQMHKEFNDYIIEQEDPIKYQYFNETFDDISRATEIHHKLVFLADLVKIIKNKKQITFMDLYMQT